MRPKSRIYGAFRREECYIMMQYIDAYQIAFFEDEPSLQQAIIRSPHVQPLFADNTKASSTHLRLSPHNNSGQC